MTLDLYRTTWGIEEAWETLLPRLAGMGYAGIEAPLIHLQRHDPDGALLRHNGLRCIPMLFTEGDDPAAHAASFRTQFEAAVAYAPPVVTCHSGRDRWSDAEAERYFARVLAIEADFDVPAAHETHRGRILYNPWTTARLLDRFDGLRLCADFSHWVCVCERLLDGEEAILEACAGRTAHVHARVGYAEGPQVPDPADPAFSAELEAHERWWDAVWADQKRRGVATSTLTPEFGPPPYLHTAPHTGQPAADLWSVCAWMTDRQRSRFNARYPAP
ncbi:MAG: TIM barrel protein [Rhodothermales bacterium]